MGSVNVDSREKGLSREEMKKRAVWRQLVRNIDPTRGKYAVEEEPVGTVDLH